MKRIVMFFIVLLFSVDLIASSRIEFKLYTVDGVVYSLPKKLTNKYLKGFERLAENISSCEDISVTITNPLIKKNNTLILKKVNDSCILIYQRDERWEYQCYLSKDDGDILFKEFMNDAQGAGLGELSLKEQHYFFYSKHCSYSKL